MTHFTPRTAKDLKDSLAELPNLTAPTQNKVLALEDRIGTHLSSSRSDLCTSSAEYKAFNRLFSNKRLTAKQLAHLLCSRLYARCARRCAGRDVIAICDTCEFSLSGLAGRACSHDAKQLGVLSDNSTKGLKAHCISCFDSDTLEPLGIAHVLIYASPKKKAHTKKSPDKPLVERQSARWVDGIHSALSHSVHTARMVTFIADAEADQYMMLAGMFRHIGTTQHTGEQHDDAAEKPHTPEVRWCLRMTYDRLVRDESVGYWNANQLKISQHLDQHCSADSDRCVRLTLAASGSRHERDVAVRVRSVQASLRRPPESGINSRAKHFRGRPISDCAPIHVTLAEQLDEHGKGCGRMSSKERARYHRKKENRRHSAPIHWMLATSFPVNTEQDQLDVLDLYGKRWIIELYFRMLKSDGLDMERNASRCVDRWICILLLGMDKALTAEKLVAMRDGDGRDGSAEFSAEQMQVLEADDYVRCHPEGEKAGKVYVSSNKQVKGTVSWYAVQVAIMAGYLGGKNSPPGRKLMAKGLKMLAIKVEALQNQARFEQKQKSVP